MVLPTEAVAAFWGAGAAAVTTLLIKYGGWLLARKKRAKAIKVALYYEVFRHQIIDMSRTGETPDLVLIGFARAVYDTYLGEIPDLLPEDLVAVISLYYSNVTAAASLLQLIEEGTAEAQAAAVEAVHLEAKATIANPVHPAAVEILQMKGRQIIVRNTDTMMQTRFLLLAAMAEQEKLLATLRKVFKRDPAREPVEVPEKYAAWFEKAAEARLKKQ